MTQLNTLVIKKLKIITINQINNVMCINNITINKKY